MTRSSASAQIRSRRIGARGIARGIAEMAAISKRGCMRISMCMCIGCLEGCRPDTAQRPGY